MLKLLRKGAIENVWFYRVIMIVISMAFVITMGWWGFKGSSVQPVVARVGGVPITLEQYQQAYDGMHRFYRDLFKEKFNEDLVKQLDLKKTVVHNLVEKQLWLLAARRIGLEVTDRELSDFILRQQAFQREGRFDPEVYRRVLALNHYAPEVFERQQRDDLAVEKIKSLLKASVTVTGIELQELQTQPNSPQEASPPANPEQLQGLLLRKQQMVLETYLNSLKAQTPISIDERML